MFHRALAIMELFVRDDKRHSPCRATSVEMYFEKRVKLSSPAPTGNVRLADNRRAREKKTCRRLPTTPTCVYGHDRFPRDDSADGDVALKVFFISRFSFCSFFRFFFFFYNTLVRGRQNLFVASRSV